MMGGTSSGKRVRLAQKSTWPHVPSKPPGPLPPFAVKRVTMSPVCFSPHNQKGKKSVQGSQSKEERAVEFPQHVNSMDLRLLNRHDANHHARKLCGG